MGQLTRREFLNLSIAGAAVVLAPAVSYAFVTENDSSVEPISFSDTEPSSSREFFHQSGVLWTRQWQFGDAHVAVRGCIVTLTTPGLGTTSFDASDFQCGFAQERLTDVLGWDIAEEILREIL